jgi:S1-C subfamily serine protease
MSLVLLALPNFGCASSAAAARRADRSRAEKSFDFNRWAAVTVHAFTVIDGKRKFLWLGSGVYLGINGIVLTNHHVATDDNKPPRAFQLEVCLVAEGAAAPCISAEVVALDEDDDLALLRTALPSLAPIRIRSNAEPMREAERVYARPAFGFYLTPSLVYGRFVGHRLEAETDLYDLAVMPGSSGSPVFDLKGRLVGVTHALTTIPGRVFSVVVPAQTIRQFLSEHPELFQEHVKLYP